MLLDANLTPSLIANLSPNQIMEIAHDKRGTHSLQALIHVCQEEDPFEALARLQAGTTSITSPSTIAPPVRDASGPHPSGPHRLDPAHRTPLIGPHQQVSRRPPSHPPLVTSLVGLRR